MNNLWFNKSTETILADFGSNIEGLTNPESKNRLLKYGQNKLPEAKSDSLLVIFFRQFQSPLIYILFAAAVITLFLKEYTDGGLILFVLFFNAIVGTIQEGKAQNTLLALKNYVATKATVLRDGKESIISDSELVPGDIIVLQEGEKIPTDARLLVSNQLRLDESTLTGESEPVSKISEILETTHLPISDQKNMVFKGTHIVAGNGKAIVVATGLDTYIGKISKEIATIDTEIPLKTNIRYLSRLIVYAVIIIGTLLIFLGIAHGNPLSEMFRTVVSLAVSIIPEGLPIVMTLILTTGVWRMSKRNALIKKLYAVEALGQTKIIAVDKTGTITKNEMMVQKVFINGKCFQITGEGYEPKGEVKIDGKTINLSDFPELETLSLHTLLSSGANVTFEKGNHQVSGDPTEAAMLVFANKLGIDRDKTEKDLPKIAETPFDYRHKLRTVVNQEGLNKIMTVSGAPETILKLSQKIWRDGKVEELSLVEVKKLESTFQEMSKEGLRVVAIATSDKISTSLKLDEVNSLTFLGFLGMKDALRPEVHNAVQKAHSAGIRIVMITGDHPITAKAVAQEAGIFSQGDMILTGEELEKLSETELSEKLDYTSVFARVTPEHKLMIIKAFRTRGEIIAMTGDGVNDAPSLVAADLGVAMGKIGTEVTKEAADIVLLDDNFGSIVSAVEEGRSIYKTIKKVILYLFSTSIGEVLTISGALVLGWALPILPAQIIWLNLVTDGFLDMSLAMEPKEDGLLKEKPEKPSKYLIDSLMTKRIILMALPMMVGTLYLFSRFYQVDITKAWTISLTTLAVFQWFNAWNCRSEEKSIFQMRFFSNKFLVGATIIVILLQMLAVYNPIMQRILHTTPLNFIDWVTIITISLSIIVVEEIRKYFYRLGQKATKSDDIPNISKLSSKFIR
ncbi:TPA: ATPase [Candidatus Berkelbacteria bacterium]|uniref:P-type HAD superfamily ATPase n=1 Tax=Berkelbacteria bacterium GW2011_GWE1_39_12 TaxID=1618337 RepID=A0A0G4B4S9_9BACT|nr:MAG: P-type HAD superfamily ATPase [Berkelbacteria bacterium GW2011_GWE1_39_12]HBO61004.1 ATPase [Candidatus Berkelbacteria bacterium]